MDYIPLRKHRSEYSIVPTDPDPQPARPRKWRRFRVAHFVSLRRVVLCLTCAPIIILFAILYQGIPPSYDDIRNFERHLPQHAVVTFTHANSRPTRYLRFPGHLWGHGLNNILQEALMMSYLSYVSNVTFVFEDYTWSHIPLPWTIYDFALRPTHIPLNAIISGPTAGGPMSDASETPLAVSAEFYQRVCAGPGTTPYILSSADAPNDADGTIIIDWWRSQLANADAECIEIDSSTHDLFDRFFFGGPRILSIFDALAASPILADYAWSPLVQSALARNFALLQPRSAKDVLSSDISGTFHGLVAVHLRRGDYSRHCPNLAKWGAEYMGINQHRSLIDRFDPRPFANDSIARDAYYLEHCLPSTAQLIARLREVRAQRPGLRRVFVLSNERTWVLADLRYALERDGWADVKSTADVQLDSAQYYVSMAVDMAIAERAEVFVGNGFSSLTSNVVMLRLAKGMDPSTNRFL